MNLLINLDIPINLNNKKEVNNMAVLKNVPISWASITSPNTKYTHQWEIQATLTKEQAAKLLAESKEVNSKGIKIVKEDDGTLTYRFKRKVFRADGVTPNNQPVLVDAKGRKFTELLGNGSICNIQYGFASYDNAYGKGVVNDLKGVQVLTHVPYSSQDGSEFDMEEDGTDDGNFSDKTSKTSPSEDYDDEDFS